MGRSGRSIGFIISTNHTINYDGTMEEWNAVKKGQEWKTAVPAICKVVCSDGTIAI